MTGSDTSKKALLIFLLIGTIAFILVTIPLIVKSNNGAYCEVVNNNPDSLKNTQPSSVILDNTNEYFYSSVYDSNNEHSDELIVRSEYCFLSNNTGSKPLTANIISSDKSVLTKAIIPTGVNNNCYPVTRQAFIGVQCVSCNSTDTLIVYRNSVSNYEDIVFNDEGLNTNTLAITTKDFINCKDLTRKILVSYIIFVTLILFSYLIVLGVNGFEEILPKWR